MQFLSIVTTALDFNAGTTEDLPGRFNSVSGSSFLNL